MESSLIKVEDIAPEKPGELLLVQDQKVVQTFSSHAPQKAFTYGICLWSPIRGSKHFDATCCCYLCKTRPKFAIIIPNEVFRCLPVWSCFPQLLRYPLISRRARHIYMDDFPRFQFNDEEGKQLTEEEVCHLQKITGPHLCRMIAEKCLPTLATRSFWMNLPHILLNSAFTHPNIQLEELAPNALRPQSRLLVAICLINVIVSCESLGLLKQAFDLCFQNTRKSPRCQRRSVSG